MPLFTVFLLNSPVSENLLNATPPTEDLIQVPALKVAEFSGSSFVVVPAPLDIVDYLDLRINFKPNTHSGLLFYWQDAGRYLAVFMERGFVNVQVTMGSDTAILRRVKTICRCEFPTPLLANFVLKHDGERCSGKTTLTMGTARECFASAIHFGRNSSFLLLF